MHIQFYTDDTISGKGFHAQYLLVPHGAVANQNRLSLSPLVVNQAPNSPPSFYRSEQPAYQQRRPAFPVSPSRARAPFHGSRYISAIHRTSPWVSQKSLYGNYRSGRGTRAWRVPYRPPIQPRNSRRTRARIYNPHSTWNANEYRRRHPQLRSDVEYGIHEVGSATTSYLPANRRQQQQQQSPTSYRRISN